MKCTDSSMNLVLENVMKIEIFQNFCCMQSFHDIQTVFLYCDGNEFFGHFHRTDYISHTSSWIEIMYRFIIFVFYQPKSSTVPILLYDIRLFPILNLKLV